MKKNNSNVYINKFLQQSIENEDKVGSVSEYLKNVQKKLETRHWDDVVYRGEAEEYPTPCIPQVLVRKNGVCSLDKNEFYEKNILDVLTAKRLVDGDSYLEKAMNAQHGGFSSRLLDVSYNCLTALFFAVTPYYTEKIESKDQQDGYVYIINNDGEFCISKEIIDYYDEIIMRKEGWLNSTNLFNKNHKYIDHVKSNSRIVAQQGAFILFPGDEAKEIPERNKEVIIIESCKKKSIRDELKLLFGIDMFSVYPEFDKSIDEIKKKGEFIVSYTFSIENELKQVFDGIDKQLKYLYSKLKYKEKDRNFVEILNIEKELFWYKKELERLYVYCDKNADEIKDKESKYQKELVEDYKRSFNDIIVTFKEHCRPYLDNKTEIYESDLMFDIISDNNRTEKQNAEDTKSE